MFFFYLRPKFKINLSVNSTNFSVKPAFLFEIQLYSGGFFVKKIFLIKNFFKTENISPKTG